MNEERDQQFQVYRENPDDAGLFEGLEADLFRDGGWEGLVDLYELRIASPSLQADTKARVRLLFRLGQVKEERCLDLDGALAAFREVAELDAGFAPALRQMRSIHTHRENWGMALQIAEIEEQVPMEPHEEASFRAEMGHLWLESLDDTDRAMRCFEQALEIDPDHQEGLRGIALALEATHRPAEAAEAWERLVRQQRGPDRATVLIPLGKLAAGPLEDPERASECFRRALTDDPRNQEAVEALIASATAAGQWTVLPDLYERRFDLAAGARQRTAIAVEAGRLHLEQLDSPHSARLWFQRALELADDDSTVYRAIADLERHVGNDTALLEALNRVADLDDTVSTTTLIEAARLLSERDDEEQAVRYLERAQAQAPDDAAVADAICESLKRLGRGPELVDVMERRAGLAAGEPELRAAILLELATLHESSGDADASSDAYQRAFDANPGTGNAAAALVRFYRKNEAWDSLRKLLERAAQDGPAGERSTRACELGELLIDEFDQPEAAADAFARAAELEPDDARALRGLSLVASQTGDDAGLLAANEREAEVAGDPARLAALVTDLVPMLTTAGRPRDAIRWLEKLLQLTPERLEALESLAQLQRELGDREALAATLTRLEALSQGSRAAAIQRELSQLCTESDRGDEAIDWLERAVENDPRNRETLERLITHYEGSGRLEPLVRTRRRLAELLPDDERFECLAELAGILDQQLGDPDGAIVILWKLTSDPRRTEEIELRLETLLERSGRFEELAQHLEERRQRSQTASPAAHDLDLRRASVLLDRLGQFEAAAALYRAAHEADPTCEDSITGLERALRAGGDIAGLTALIAERAQAEDDPAARARLQFERAVLLEETLSELGEARSVYEGLVDTRVDGEAPDPGVATEAQARLENLLERSGEWDALRASLESALAGAPAGEHLALHERLAALCRDRLGDHPAAISHLEAAVALEPGEAAHWRRLALLYQETGDSTRLLEAIDGELAADPGEARELALRARAARLYAEQPEGDGAACEQYERLLELEPGHSEACEFLLDYYRRENQSERLVGLLEQRLRATDGPVTDSDARASRTGLRLRIAALQAESDDDLDTAIATLEDAVAEEGPVALVAEPLADLYQRAGHDAALASLARQVADACHDPRERAGWRVRQGQALRCAGDLGGAAEVLRAALEDQPEQPAVEEVLRELYRELDQPAPLAQLLQASIALPTDDSELDLARRRELARLLEHRLGRSQDALEAWLSILDLEPSQRDALDAALRLSESLQQHQRSEELLQRQLACSRLADERASLHERHGDLLAGPLDRLDQAPAAYREALSEDPSRQSVLHSLRSVLERLERWPAALDCLYLEAQATSGDERHQLYQRATELAAEHLSADATLPWLERMRAERPGDAEILGRIADVHRRAGRPEAVLRALTEQLGSSPDPATARDLHLDRARVLERDLNAPARAIGALEAARAAVPGDEQALRELDRLYELAGRTRERLSVVEERLETASPEDALALHRRAAELAAAHLCDPEAASSHLHRALEVVANKEQRISLLRELAQCRNAAGDVAGRVAAGESELELLEPDDPQRGALHRELAQAYASDLANSDAALRHLRALAAAAEENSASISAAQLQYAEDELIEQLRRARSPIELERRLSKSLERNSEQPEGWLELARLRDEQLCAPVAAADAYREVLQRSPRQLAAIRGLRTTSERLGDWPEVIRSIELELDTDGAADPHPRAALHQRAGELYWHRLGDRDRAREAFEAQLAALGEDRCALRPLQQLCVEQEEFAQAVSYYEREAELSCDDDPAQAQSAWLAAGALARDQLGDDTRALRAYQQAATCAPLLAPEHRALACLYQAAGEAERFVDEFGAWLDRDDAQADSRDALRLAHALYDGGNLRSALARAQLACELEPRWLKAWDLLADFAAEDEDPERAAEALERAAALCAGQEAADRLLRAAELLENTDVSSALDALRAATDHCPGFARAQAQRAQLACGEHQWAEARSAAGTALDLAGGSLSDDLRLATALSGGRAACELSAFPQAAAFFGTALEIDPDHSEALSAQGHTLFEIGDLSGARQVLERRLEQGDDDPERAQHLAIVGLALERERDARGASEIYRAAIEVERALSEAHEGLARVLEMDERPDEAIEALVAWSEIETRAPVRAEALLRAGLLSRKLIRPEDAEAHLRAAVEAHPECHQAWAELAETLWEAERSDDTLAVCAEALTCAPPPAIAARISRVAAAAHEQRADLNQAAIAYQDAARMDPRAVDCALAASRLQRAAGHFDQAAATLLEFAERHPEPEDGQLATIHFERARLLAGPLERVDDAIPAYRRAIALRPEFDEARERLADLLSHVPEHWAEAVTAHCELLRSSPTRFHSIRALTRIAVLRGHPAAAAPGTALQLALGASPEAGQAPGAAALPAIKADGAVLPDALHEQLRIALHEVASDLATCNHRNDTDDPESARANDEVREIQASLREVVDELSAPGVFRSDPEALRALLLAAACVATGVTDERAVSERVDALESTLGRWGRRKIRRALEGVSVDQIADVDFAQWSHSIRAAACERLLDRGDCELRVALLALCDGSPTIALCEGSDLRTLVGTSPAARCLLVSIVSQWCDTLIETL